MKAKILNIFGLVAIAGFICCGSAKSEKEEPEIMLTIIEQPLVVETVAVNVVSTPIEEAIEETIEEVADEVQLYNTPLDEDIQEAVIDLCGDEFDAAIVFAMIERESSCNSQAIGDGGNSKGLMQIQTKWHSERMKNLGCDDLLDPIQNVTVGIDYLKELSSMNDSIEWVLMAYNGGFKYANARTNPSDYALGILKRAEELKGERNGNSIDI